MAGVSKKLQVNNSEYKRTLEDKLFLEKKNLTSLKVNI